VVSAAREHGRIVQTGTQARSCAATRDSIEWMQAGGLGQVELARGLCYKRRGSIGKVSRPQEPPATCDYDLWTGPARLVPLARKRLHYDWHWDFNTGNGDLGNQGVHQMDIARWGLGRAGLPTSVLSCGGRIGYDDDGDTPNTQIATFDYGDKQLIFEVRGLPTKPYRETHIGVIFHCADGYLVNGNYSKVVAFDRDAEVVKVFEGGGNHFQNFLDAVKSGKREDLTAECLEGHLSAALCHLANVSYRLGQPHTIEQAPAAMDEATRESFAQCCEHLAANGLDASTKLVLGPLLAFDAERERFVGERAEEASVLAARTGRTPFTASELG